MKIQLWGLASETTKKRKAHDKPRWRTLVCSSPTVVPSHLHCDLLSFFPPPYLPPDNARWLLLYCRFVPRHTQSPALQWCTLWRWGTPRARKKEGWGAQRKIQSRRAPSLLGSVTARSDCAFQRQLGRVAHQWRHHGVHHGGGGEQLVPANHHRGQIQLLQEDASHTHETFAVHSAVVAPDDNLRGDSHKSWNEHCIFIQISFNNSHWSCVYMLWQVPAMADILLLISWWLSNSVQLHCIVFIFQNLFLSLFNACMHYNTKHNSSKSRVSSLNELSICLVISLSIYYKTELSDILYSKVHVNKVKLLFIGRHCLPYKGFVLFSMFTTDPLSLSVILSRHRYTPSSLKEGLGFV